MTSLNYGFHTEQDPIRPTVLGNPLLAGGPLPQTLPIFTLTGGNSLLGTDSLVTTYPAYSVIELEDNTVLQQELENKDYL